MKRVAHVACLAAMSALSCCSPPEAPPAPAPRPAPQPVPTPPPPPPAPADWRDVPLTPGNWSDLENGADKVAAFGTSPAAPIVALRCDAASRSVTLTRSGATAGGMTIRTSSVSRTLTASPSGGGLAASLPSQDPLLDAIAFSRGRITIETTGQPMLVLPAEPEPARLVEDCRG